MAKKEESEDWVYDYIFGKISSPEFRNPIKNYIDENCGSFIDVQENTFQQGALFNEFTQLVDNLLDKVLKDCGLTEEQFLLASKKGLENQQHKKYFEQLISFNNYEYFKSMMTKRNYQFIQMAEQAMQKDKKVPQKLLATTKEQKELEEKQIQSAIKMSLVLEDQKRRIAVLEEEDLKRAIRLSQMEMSKQKQGQPPKKEEPKKTAPPLKEEMPKVSNQSAPATSKVNINLQSQLDNKGKPIIGPSPELTIESAKKGFNKQVELLSSEFGISNDTEKSKQDNNNIITHKVISIDESFKNVELDADPSSLKNTVLLENNAISGNEQKTSILNQPKTYVNSDLNNNTPLPKESNSFRQTSTNQKQTQPHSTIEPIQKKTEPKRENIKKANNVEAPKVVQAPVKEIKKTEIETTKINVESIKKEESKPQPVIENKPVAKDPLEQLMDQEFGQQEPTIEVSNKGIKFSNFSPNPEKKNKKEEIQKQPEKREEKTNIQTSSITSSTNNFLDNEQKQSLPKIKEKKLGKFFDQQFGSNKFGVQPGLEAIESSVSKPVGSVIQEEKDEDLLKKFSQIEQEKAKKMLEYREKILQMKKEKRAEKEKGAQLSKEDLMRIEQRKLLAEKLKNKSTNI